MNGLKTKKSATARVRNLASIAMLFGAIFVISVLPAHAQQEIDPTWYDPMPVAAAVHSTQATASAHVLQPVVTHRYLQASTQVSQTVQSRKEHAKTAQSDSIASNATENTRILAADKKTTLIASSK